MSIEKIRAFFSAFTLDHQILKFDVSSATIQLAASALHCEAARIAKTLSFESRDGALLVVTAGDALIERPPFIAALNAIS